MESRGSSSDTSFRLCSRAPRTTSRSATALNSPSQDEGSPAHDDGPPGQNGGRTYADQGHVMVFGATDKTPPRRESFPARAPRGPRCPGHPLAGHTARPAPPGPRCPGDAPRAAPPSPRLLPGCHSVRDDGPELRQRSPVDTEIALARPGGESTDRLLATADALTDAQAAAPSRLPGWTRGHVLTHLARNADGFRNLLAWAAHRGPRRRCTPARRPGPRPSRQGAGRSAAELAADLRESAAAFAAAAAGTARPGLGRPVARRGEHVPGPGNPAAAAVRAGDPSRRPGRGIPAGRLAAGLRAADPGPGGPRFRRPRRTRPPAWPARMAWMPPSRSARHSAGPGQRGPPGDRVRPASSPAGLADSAGTAAPGSRSPGPARCRCCLPGGSPRAGSV